MNFMNNLSGNSMQTNDSGMQLNNVDVLYTKVQRIYIKSERKEERQRDLRINVEIHAGISPVCRKSLCLRLSDDDDSCFLYSLMINDEDFKNLKADQNLLVDFDNFATQLISLLDQCHVPSTGASKVPPKFLLELYEERGEWFCRFVEPKTIKNLCHLYLKISPASDDDIKTHMAVKIKQLTDNVNNKNRDIVNMETRLNSMSDELDKKIRELDQFEQKYYSEKSQLEMQTSHQLKIEKDRFTQAKLEWQRTNEIEKMELERRYNDTIKQMEIELADVKLQNSSYRDKQTTLELTNSEQSKRLQLIENELTITQRDLSQLQKTNTKLEIDYQERDKLLNDSRTKVAVLEQELKDKNLLINEHIETIKSTKEQKKKLEDKLNDRDSQLQRKEKNLNMIHDDLRRSSDETHRMQNKISMLDEKIRRRESTLEEQQKLLETKQKEIVQLSLKIDENIEERKQMKAEIDSQKSKIKLLETTIGVQEKKIKDDSTLIDYLHRKTSDNQSPINQVPLTPINIGSQFQLTIPRQTKFDQINSRSTFTPSATTAAAAATTPPVAASTTPHYTGTLNSGFGIRNTTSTSTNVNQTSKNLTSRTIGLTSDTPGLGTFSRPEFITNTSTPIERMNIYQKIPNRTEITNNNQHNNDNNTPSTNDNIKTKNTITFAGGLLRRNIVDKPLLPSAYFPKTMH